MMAQLRPTTRPRKKDMTTVSFSGRYKDLIEGRISVESLDVEELARCQLKDKNGRFTGRPPAVLPRSIVQQMRREFFARGDKIFESSYVDAVKTMVSIMHHAEDDSVRLKAAQYIIERLTGKTPDRVVFSADAPWQVIMEKILVRADDPAIEDIEDAEIVDEA